MIHIPDPIDASARRLLKSSLRNFPELRALAPEDALEIVKEAMKMAADKQDVSLYEKATRLSNIVPFVIVMLLLPILGLGLFFWSIHYRAGIAERSRLGHNQLRPTQSWRLSYLVERDRRLLFVRENLST